MQIPVNFNCSVRDLLHWQSKRDVPDWMKTLSLRYQRRRHSLERSLQQSKCILPIVHARNANGRMSVTMGHRNGNCRDASQRALDRARIRAATTWLAQLIWNRFRV